MIKNIVFDMGGVLMDFDPEAFADEYELYGEDRAYLLNAVFYSEDWVKLDEGLYTDEEFAKLKKSQLPSKYWDAFDKLFWNWDKICKSKSGTRFVVKELKEKGYKLYLLSNAGYRHKDYWKSVKGSEYFDGLVVSAFYHQMKPKYDIYKTLFNKFDLDPKECLFIDDLPENIKAGSELGMDTIVFHGSRQLREELVKKGIL